ncbi:hypothetical protein Ddye_027319 [Dipteronia dyeriana]|uniref:Disease resistance N-terminal domain-containing protein n=1 Tax=Dipteronia dyeriana TaxID=168575 RepID=A0AAD9WQ27_9ROSI|nr:hypothetical protein Ddye_027319 [Dipteronia dyeriana]
MADLIVSAVLPVLFEKLMSAELLNFATQKGDRVKLKKWERTLKMIKAILIDAEDKQLTNEAVKMWLEDLQDLAYDAEDILDEYATEALRRKLKIQEYQAASTSRARKLIPACCIGFTPSALWSDFSIRSKIDDITSRLDDLCRQRTELGLVEIAGGRSTTASLKRPPTSKGLETLSSLRKLFMIDCRGFSSFPKGQFPDSDLTVNVIGCEKLEALPSGIHNISSLRIYNCPNIRLSEKLARLSISDRRQYKALMELGLHNLTSLTYLSISGQRDVESLQEEDMRITLPRSLTQMSLENFLNLKYLSFKDFEHLPSLEFLRIRNCPELTSLPSLPPSLLQLHIRECPLLKEAYKSLWFCVLIGNNAVVLLWLDNHQLDNKAAAALAFLKLIHLYLLSQCLSLLVGLSHFSVLLDCFPVLEGFVLFGSCTPKISTDAKKIGLPFHLSNIQDVRHRPFHLALASWRCPFLFEAIDQLVQLIASLAFSS